MSYFLNWEVVFYDFSVLMTLKSEDGNENGSYKKDVLYYIAQFGQMFEAWSYIKNVPNLLQHHTSS